ncbi:unnamed protein product [Peniophora sp. CBMAI 1063]|nr:unnamed protein product [Peniophora sp. CBMAI 1063]
MQHDPACGYCRRDFDDWKSLEQHWKTSSVHAISPRLVEWDLEESVATDYDNTPRYLPVRGVERYCVTCEGWFQVKPEGHCHVITLGRAKPHQSAARDLKCPFFPRMFGQPSAIAQYIECGACGAARTVDRHQVTTAVHALEVSPSVSIAHSRLGAAHPTVPSPMVTEMAWNSHVSAYECYLCHLRFKSLPGLNQHLASPAHDQNEFRCPQPTCAKEFKIMSALVQHIESEACGLARFADVREHTKALTDRFSM